MVADAILLKTTYQLQPPLGAVQLIVALVALRQVNKGVLAELIGAVQFARFSGGESAPSANILNGKVSIKTEITKVRKERLTLE